MDNSNKAWFERWFDSPYYHILYRHRDQEEAVNFLSNLVRHTSMSGETAWDMACGKGRHAIYLSSLGVEVVASDISAQSIHAASEMESERLSFFIHDMRMPVRINYFDVVLNLFTSFGYFHTDRENEMVITSACKALKKDGLFVLDYFNSERVVANLNPHEEKTIEGITFIIKKELTPHNSIVKSISFEADGVQHLYHEEVKLYDKSMITGMLDKAALVIQETFGNYELQPYDEQSSDRLIIIAKK